MLYNLSKCSVIYLQLNLHFSVIRIAGLMLCMHLKSSILFLVFFVSAQRTLKPAKLLNNWN